MKKQMIGKKLGKAALLPVCMAAVMAGMTISSSSAIAAAIEDDNPLLAPFYDAREDGKVPVIRSQGTLGTCWALSCVSALEAGLMPDEHMVFSADHLSLNNGFSITQKEGGDYYMIMAYLSSWRGPVLESEDPYGDGKTADGLQACAYVGEMHLLKGMSTEEIKQSIIQYGPVQTSLNMDRKMTSSKKNYYNKDAFAFYCPEELSPTHDILILGWDDHFPKESFAQTPEHDGAYICQNTWGEDFGADGIFYVSYDDANIARSGLAYSRITSQKPYDQLYQYDTCGWQGRLGYDTDTCWFSNVYTAETNENLSAVGFYCIGEEMNYTVYIAHRAKENLLMADKTELCSGTINGAGYYTIDLPEEVPVNEGERFAVIVQARTPENGKQAAVELEHDQYTVNVTTEGKESYISADGTIWENTQVYYGTNVCLKAYMNR